MEGWILAPHLSGIRASTPYESHTVALHCRMTTLLGVRNERTETLAGYFADALRSRSGDTRNLGDEFIEVLRYGRSTIAMDLRCCAVAAHPVRSLAEANRAGEALAAVAAKEEYDFLTYTVTI